MRLFSRPSLPSSAPTTTRVSVTWGYQTIAQMTAALLRLGVLGHRAATALIAALQPVVEDGARRVLDLGAGDVASFAPRLEIASMRHERQYSRLFRS